MIGRRKFHQPLQAKGSYPSLRPYLSPPGKRRVCAVPGKDYSLYIPLSVLEATDRVMRRYGREQRECYVWWGGYFTAQGFGQVVTALWPEIPTSYGRIHLTHHELAALQERLRILDQVLLAELHTHPPGAGGQNEVDAAHPASTHYGFLSIVVPDFAYPYLYDLRRTHVYSYRGAGRWQQLRPAEIEERLVVEESSGSITLS